MAEITPSNKKQKSFSRSLHHRSTRVDLTPMVDLGFLLLSFFVFTSAMSQPMAMNIMQPMDGPSIPVKQSGAMTIILGKNHRLYYYYGELNVEKQIRMTSFKDIRQLITDKKKQTDLGGLMYIIKADKHSTFGDNIDLLDEMVICDIPGGHYAEVDITKMESELIKGIE